MGSYLFRLNSFANYSVETYEGEEINNENHEVQVDIITSKNGVPDEGSTVRKQWLELSKFGVDEITESIISHKRGDLFEISYKLHEEDINAQIKIHDVRVVSYPTINNDLAIDEGFDSVEVMREKCLENYRVRIKNLQEGFVVDSIIDQIATQSNIPPLPNEWIEISAKNTMTEHIKRMGGDKRKVMTSIGATDEGDMLRKFMSHIFRDTVQSMSLRAYIQKFEINDKESDAIANHMMENVKWITD